jgi:protein O-GlcNAc transferase
MNDSRLARELHAQGRLQAAEASYRSALNAAPEDRTLRRDFAVMLMQARKEHDAVALLAYLEEDASATGDALTILALCLRAIGKYQRALPLTNRIVAREPRNALGWLLKGSLHVLLCDYISGEAALRVCLEIEDQLAEGWHYLGESLQGQRRWDEAIAAYRRAQRRQPQEILNIAICHERAGRLSDASVGYQAAHDLMPGRADVLARLAYAQSALCQFDDASRTSALLSQRLQTPLARDDRPEPFIMSALGAEVSARIKVLDHYAAPFRAELRLSEAHAERQPGDPIRIGYMSPDFGEHAVGDLLGSHFSSHDREHFEIFAYALREHNDSISREIQMGVDTFRECYDLDDATLVETIRSDRIDVLIDLAGYTSGARPGALAKRPAPLQLGWLGFLDGQQAPWLDALIMDEHLVPATEPWPYDDRVVKLKTTVFPGSTPIIGTPDRARFGLPHDAMVLCSFNNTYKLDALLSDAWIRILELAPDAHLALYLPASARANFLHAWARKGGDQRRLHLFDKVAMTEQADRMASCDLLLDTFHYQGGATSMHAIANGLPVLSFSGVTPPSRMGASINGFLGLHDLICQDVEMYVQTAVRLAKSPQLLTEMRQELAHRVLATGLFDPRRSAAAIESLVLDLMGDHTFPAREPREM